MANINFLLQIKRLVYCFFNKRRFATMNFIIFLTINLIVVLSKAQNQGSHSFLQPFVNQRPKTIAVCNLAMDDQIYEEIFEMTANFPSWVNYWDCIESGIPQVHQSLIILNEITAKNLQKVFSKSNIQNSISYNMWLIHISGTLQDVYSLFDDVKLKIGINAQLFIVQSSKPSKDIIQVIGTGHKKVNFKVKSLEEVELSSLCFYIKNCRNWDLLKLPTSRMP